jgi:hypothetical protein
MKTIELFISKLKSSIASFLDAIRCIFTRVTVEYHRQSRSSWMSCFHLQILWMRQVISQQLEPEWTPSKRSSQLPDFFSCEFLGYGKTFVFRKCLNTQKPKLAEYHRESERLVCEESGCSKSYLQVWSGLPRVQNATIILDARSSTSENRRSKVRLESGQSETFNCPMCGKSYAKSQYLKNHERNVHFELPTKFRCKFPKCNMTYTYSQSLSMHCCTVHSNPTEFPCQFPGCDTLPSQVYFIIDDVTTRTAWSHISEFCNTAYDQKK